MLKTVVSGELKKQATWSKKDVQLYHFRTTSGQEVDIILEDRSGNIVGVEVKSNERVTANDFKGLRYLQEKSKDKFITGIVMHTGKQCIPFDKKLYAIPISALWS